MVDPADAAVRTVVDDQRVCVVVTGEIDLASADIVTDGIEAALEAHAGPVVLDLSDVTFLDSYGMRALMTARVAAEQAGRSLLIVAASSTARHVITLSGAATIFGLDE